MSKFSPQPVVDAKFIVNNNQIIVTEFRDNLIVYTDVNGKIHGPINADKWNSLKARMFNEKHIDKVSNDLNEADPNSSLTSKERSKTTSFVFEYDDTTGIFTIKKDGKPIIEPWVIKGKNGENGLSAFDEWSKDNPGSFNDFIDSLKGTNGKNGQNGASAFDLWLAEQNTEYPGNIDDFFQSLKGKDGVNGKIGASAYDIWKAQGNTGSENDFIDSLKGINGKNGDNGESAYKLWLAAGNVGSEEDFLKSLKGRDGDSGKDGLNGTSAYQIWLNEGHKGDEEDFLKWIQDARKGEKGDPGDIFRPHYDERGYLYFRNRDGEKTQPERVKGDEGQIGPRGKEGKSAYQIWLDKGYIGTQQEFLDSLKGKDGSVPPPPKYGYKDVKDFLFPEIKVNPRLISSSEEITDTRTPEQILDGRIDEIKNIRELGKSKRCNWFKEFTWWCAGADKEILRLCPADHTKNTGIGTIIFFTALMAAFSGFIAISLVFDILIVQILFAILWGSMIFFLDRFITNTMYSDGDVKISKQEFINGLPRIIIAIFLGVVISAPLELKIFQKEVNKLILENDSKEKDKFVESKKEYQYIIAHLDQAERELIYTKSRYDSILSSLANQKPIETIISTSKPITANNGETVMQNIQYVRVVKSQNQINKERIEQSKIKTEETNLLEKKIYDLKREKDSITSISNSEFKEIKPGLLKQLCTLHELAFGDNYSPLGGRDENGQIRYKFWDMVLHGWWYYLFFTPIGLIMLLLILIDVSPVFYKMMLADGLYDNYLYQEKTIDQYKYKLKLLKVYEKVDESELKKIAPFIFGKEYKDFVESLKEYNNSILSEKRPDYTDEEIQKKNQKLFDEVLDMKRRIILATYRRWYKTQHDAIIGDPADDDNAGKEPFDLAEVQDGQTGGASVSKN